ncbi:MAG: HAMP domain-containing sensor histidine kinase, partial [Nocardioidaceae bacterium]
LGGFVVWQLRSDLQNQVDGEIRATSGTLIRAVRDENRDTPPDEPISSPEFVEDFAGAARAALTHRAAAAQVIGPNGDVLIRYGPAAGTASIITPQQRSAALAGSSTTFTAELGDGGERYRVHVTAFTLRDQPHYLVVGESLDPVDEAVERALLLLLIAGPVALIATGAVAYWLAYQAMRPVKQMTSDAKEIGAGQLAERVAIPTVRDEIGQLAVTLNDMLDRIEHGVSAKRRLVADASHELRTPLAVMRAEIQVSLRTDELSDEARQVLESTREEVERMSRTVDNLLTLAEADEGKLGLLTKPVRLLATVEDAARQLEPLATAKNLTVHTDGEPMVVRADLQRINQAVINLLENAVKFSPLGGTVRAWTWRTGDEVGVSVTDEGPGIPVEERDRLFDRFYRVDAARGRAIVGSGLGLAICMEVAVAHGGRVWVDSTPQHGSTFSLALPGSRALPAEDEPPEPGSQAMAHTDNARQEG